MKKSVFILLALSFLFSCANKDDLVQESLGDAQEESSSKLSLGQAKIYALLFSEGLGQNDSSQPETRAGAKQSSDIKDVDCLVEEGDTLLFSVNFRDDSGFVLISGDNSSFPILAHSGEGNLYFSDIVEDSPLHAIIINYKQEIKENIKNSGSAETEYYDDWKDLGKEGYEYEVVRLNSEPEPQTRSRRKSSSGKDAIYPETGKELNVWCQEGGYNMCAPNQACIGCPAIAIGMLLYDIRLRVNGKATPTTPSFGYSDTVDISGIDYVTATAQKLRQVADSIPNYVWGKSKGAASGATMGDIISGLKKIGYTRARAIDYDLDSLYSNLSFTGMNYFGAETSYCRGVLILGSYSNVASHIWFCDGYYKQEYKVKKKLLGITVKSWKEYDDRLYMNWGWGADGGNGWYLATDSDKWSSIDGNESVYYKANPAIIVDLQSYTNGN